MANQPCCGTWKFQDFCGFFGKIPRMETPSPVGPDDIASLRAALAAAQADAAEAKAVLARERAERSDD